MNANEKFNHDHSWNDFLDRMLDGHPVMIVDTPQLRRRLQQRAMERTMEHWRAVRRW